MFCHVRALPMIAKITARNLTLSTVPAKVELSMYERETSWPMHRSSWNTGCFHFLVTDLMEWCPTLMWTKYASIAQLLSYLYRPFCYTRCRCCCDYFSYGKIGNWNGMYPYLHYLTLSGPAFSVVRQARGGRVRGPDAKNQS